MNEFSPDTDWEYDPELEELEQLSNSVVDLIAKGHLDDAESACLELKRRFPDQIDWIERSARVYEARGDVSRAVEHYRKCLEFIDNNPDGFDSDSRDDYEQAIERLASRPA